MSLQILARHSVPSSVEMCDDCNREATVFNFEGSYCDLHSKCLECGRDEAEVGRHCADCAKGLELEGWFEDNLLSARGK